MWDIFKARVKRVMESPPFSSDDLAKEIAQAYDSVVKIPPAGDLMNKNPVQTGNVEALELKIRLVLTQQSSSPEQLDVINGIANGFIQYWAGATLQPLFPPLIPVPGAISNIIPVQQVLVTRTGIQTTIPFTYEGLDNVDGFIDKIILAANVHLQTVGGEIFTSAIFPGGITAVGVGVWTGYSVTGNPFDLSGIPLNALQTDPNKLAELKSKFGFLVDPAELDAALQAFADLQKISLPPVEGGAVGDAIPPNSAQIITDTPWSAGFISTVMKKAGISFPSNPSHTGYLNGLRSASNWTLLDPGVEPLKVGDLLVFNRAGNNQKFSQQSWYGFSHGDIIVSISGDTAFGIGGNVAQTVFKSTFKLNNGKVLGSQSAFAIARPKEKVSNIVQVAEGEYQLWSSNGWKELTAAAYPTLKEYYKTVNINV